MKICAIIPAYQEAAHIAPIVRETLKYCPYVVVVDDGSTDQTAQVAREAGATEVIRHDINRGKGLALQTGFAYAREQGFDLILTLDGDGQHAPSDIPAFLRAWERTKAPVLIGNRMENMQGMPLIRRLTNRFMSYLLSRQMRQYVPDTQCGFRLYQRDALPSPASADSDRFAAESEVLLQITQRNLRVQSVPVQTIYGNETSKIHPLRDTIRFFRMLRHFKQQQRKSNA